MQSTSTMKYGVLTVNVPKQDFTFPAGTEDTTPTNGDVQQGYDNTLGDVVEKEPGPEVVAPAKKVPTK